ncbi:tRNA synthetases class I (M)-domain-containing protein, partial [Butyriboletus roseoflavus]
MSRIALENIPSITFYKDSLTTARRTTPIAQLVCLGKPCATYQPEVVRSYQISSANEYCLNALHLRNHPGDVLSVPVLAQPQMATQKTELTLCKENTSNVGLSAESRAIPYGIATIDLVSKEPKVTEKIYELISLSFCTLGRYLVQSQPGICQSIYLNLGKHDYLEMQVRDQTYCEGCQKFLADRYVEGICPHCSFPDARGDQCDGCARTLDAIDLIEPRCLIDKTHEVVARSSSHMYFRLDKAQLQLEEWIKTSYKNGKWSPNATINAEGEIVDARLRSGLRPTPVTRDLTWGVPIPPLVLHLLSIFVPLTVLLDVWFDAVIGYPSITANYTPDWQRWWLNPDNVKLYQFMGKDNVYFHTVYFPAMLIADGRKWTTLHHISTTEYLNYEGGKFSKSKGRGVFGPAARETGIPASVWRYYLLATRPETADAMFSWADCITANNNVLLKNFGNFVNRALKFVASQYDSIIPENGDAAGALPPNDALDGEFISEVNNLLKEYINAMESVKLRLGLQTVMLISNRGNGYLQASGLNKALMTEKPKRCAQVVSRAVNLIYVLSVLVYPFMPTTSEAILQQLNAPARSVPGVLSTDILAGHRVGKPDHLFKTIDEKMEEVWKVKFGGVDGQKEEVPVLKRKAKKVVNSGGKADAAMDGTKSPEAIALEAKILAQGNHVRALKENKTEKDVIDAAVLDLKRLKTELANLGNV